MSYRVRRIKTSEKEKLKAFVKGFSKTIQDFNYTWERWRNWEKSFNMPYVAVEGSEIIGFHAATFSIRTGYVYTYFIAVSPNHRGKKIGGALMEACLKDAARMGLKRIKFKCHKNSEGSKFFEGLGARAVLEDDNDLMYDHTIENITSVADLVIFWKYCYQQDEIPAKSLEKYFKQGMRVRK